MRRSPLRCNYSKVIQIEMDADVITIRYVYDTIQIITTDKGESYTILTA